MSRNGSGIYSLAAGNPVVTGTTVSSTWANSTLTDIASALTTSIASDGQTVISANIPMNSKKLTGLAAPTLAGDALSFGAVATISTLTATTVNSALNGTLGATTPSTVVATDLTTTGNTILGNASTDTLNVGNGGLIKDASGQTFIGTGVSTLSGGLKLGVETGITLFYAPSPSVYNTSIYCPNGGTVINANGDSAGISFGTTNIGGSSATTKMTLDASGNLGIGVTPSAWNTNVKAAQLASGSLYSYSTVDLELTQNCYYNTSNQWIYSTTAPAERYSMYNGAHIWYTAPSGTAGNAITFTQAMTIDTSGNLLVGTASALGTAARTAILFDEQAVIGISLKSSNATTGGYYQYFINSAGVLAGSISHTGTTTVAYNTSSDYRLKENIAPMTGALDTIAKLKPVTYNWKEDGSDGQGFIAHELQEVVPDCVTGEKDATREEEYEISPAIPAVLDEEGVEVTPAVEAVMGTRTVPVYQGIDTSFLVATLTAAIQEQQAMIDELKSKVAALEAK